MDGAAVDIAPARARAGSPPVGGLIEDHALRSALAHGLREGGLTLAESVQRRLLGYLALLEKWNRVCSLVSPVGVERWLRCHLLDSLSVLGLLPSGSLVDVGSGGGLPGLPLAIALPDKPVTLVESRQRQAAFLRQVVLELALSNVTVVHQRSERHRGQFDAVICRALGGLGDFVRVAGHLCAPGGCLLAMKARLPERETRGLARSGFRVDAVHVLHFPERHRRLVVLRPAPDG